MIPVPRQVSDLLEDVLRFLNVEVLDGMTNEERGVIAAALTAALQRNFRIEPLEDLCSSE